MIQDKTYKVKVWDHNDAVVFVYDNVYTKTVDPKDPEKSIHKQSKDVITAIPINFGYEENLTNEDKVKMVERVASSLEDVYSCDPDTDEIGVVYYINRQCINF